MNLLKRLAFWVLFWVYRGVLCLAAGLRTLLSRCDHSD